MLFGLRVAGCGLRVAGCGKSGICVEYEKAIGTPASIHVVDFFLVTLRLLAYSTKTIHVKMSMKDSFMYKATARFVDLAERRQNPRLRPSNHRQENHYEEPHDSQRNG